MKLKYKGDREFKELLKYLKKLGRYNEDLNYFEENELRQESELIQSAICSVCEILQLNQYYFIARNLDGCFDNLGERRDVEGFFIKLDPENLFLNYN